MSKEDPLRCGLCDVEVIGSFEDHVKTEEHQNRLSRIVEQKKALATYVEVLKKVSAATQKSNRDKIAKAENLGYYSVSNGRSYYRLKCECGEISDVFAWKGCKRCPNCKKILHTILSFGETTIE